MIVNSIADINVWLTLCRVYRDTISGSSKMSCGIEILQLVLIVRRCCRLTGTFSVASMKGSWLDSIFVSTASKTKEFFISPFAFSFLLSSFSFLVILLCFNLGVMVSLHRNDALRSPCIFTRNFMSSSIASTSALFFPFLFASIISKARLGQNTAVLGKVSKKADVLLIFRPALFFKLRYSSWSSNILARILRSLRTGISALEYMNNICSVT